MTDAKRNRPSRATEAIPKTFGGVGSSVVDSADAHPDHPVCFECQHAAILYGIQLGIPMGRELEASERDALHRRAYEVVQAMSRIEPRDAQVDAERAAQREQWWAERRGEGAA